MAVTNTVRTLNNITSTTTGAAIDITNARRATVGINAAAISSGNCAFSVEVSPNAISGPRRNPAETVVWATYNRLITNAANDNTETLARASSVQLTTNITNFFTLDLEEAGDVFEAMRVVGTVTTDGTYNAWVTTVDFPNA